MQVPGRNMLDKQSRISQTADRVMVSMLVKTLTQAEMCSINRLGSGQAEDRNVVSMQAND